MTKYQAEVKLENIHKKFYKKKEKYIGTELIELYEKKIKKLRNFLSYCLDDKILTQNEIDILSNKICNSISKCYCKINRYKQKLRAKNNQELKVIFLDFDGVVNSGYAENMCLPLFNHAGQSEISCYYFSSDCIEPFLELMKSIYKNDYRIVISSTWRKFGSTEDFNAYFKKYFKLSYYFDWDKTDLVIGKTGNTLSSNEYKNGREREIQEWIDKYKPNKYLIIDDEVEHGEHSYQTNVNTGLTMEDVENIKGMLVQND